VIEACRTAALGGHVEGGHRRIACNSCRSRHCPKCQGAAAREWLAAREADLLPVGYLHVVPTLPAEVADLAFHNKAVAYDLLFRAASETMTTIAADPRHLGARIGITAVPHPWGSAMTRHPPLHMIVPGGISLDGERWVSSRPAFSGPEAVLACLSRYTRRIAISNRRLIAFDEAGATFRYKDYRRNGADRQRTMTLHADEFIRRFLVHVLPQGFHRIRHYRLPARAGRKANLALPTTARQAASDAPPDPRPPCPCCGGRMVVIEVVEPATRARAASPAPASRNGGAVTRHGQPRLHVKVPPLRPSGSRARSPSESCTDAPMTPQPHHLPAWHRAIDVFDAHPRASSPRYSGQPPRSGHLRACTGFLKTPPDYA
jgi:hypothetical protein